MKIGPGVSELWGGGRKSPSLIDKARRLYNSLYYRTSRDKDDDDEFFSTALNNIVNLCQGTDANSH